MPQYQGVWSLQQQMQALTSGQWATDPLFDYTTLLLQADNAANSAQNNTFLDSSTNAFAITRNGNTTQGTFSPFSATGWSNFFDGTGDYLTSTVSSVGSSGDLTVEGWVYPTASGVRRTFFFVGSTGTFDLNLFTEITAANVLRFLIRNDSVIDILDISSTATVSANTWSHVAFVLSGTSATIYLNGVSVATGTLSGARTGTFTTGSIGALLSGGATHYFNGYISNLRYVKGTAVYTAAFTPPTAPLTAITNTSLLTCQSNRFIDNSSNAYTITRNGDTSVQAFSPFAPQFQYTASVTGGSGYFDGTGDFLTVPANTAFAPGTGNFTVDGWIYPTSSSVQNFFAQTVSGTNYFLCTADVPNKQINIRSAASGAGTAITSAATLQLNQWNHFCISRTSGTITVWCNGSAGTPTSNTIDLNNTSYVPTISGYTHATGTEPLVGYLSGLRYIKGTALSGATVPTAPPTAITNTSLLCNFTNAGILDGTMKNNLETVGNAQVSTSVVKYGSGSIKFNGSTDYLLIRPDAPIPLFVRTADFTVEAWIYLSSTSAANYMLWGNNGPDIQFYVDTSAKLVCAIGAVGGPTGSITIPTNTWVHVAATRTAGYINLFVNGVFDTRSTLGGTSNLNNSKYYIGTNTISYFNGYIDDMRFTLGVARYITSFTPPSVALPRQ